MLRSRNTLYCFALANRKRFQNQSGFSTITNTDGLLWFPLCLGAETSGDAPAAQWAVPQRVVGGCQRQGAVELVVPALPTLKAVPACRCRCCQLKRFYKLGNCLMTEGVLLAAASLDGCLLNNLLAVAVLGLCRPAMWQAF